MSTPLPSATREIRLVTTPEGLTGPEHVAVVAQHALVAAADCTPVDDVLPDPVAHLSSGSAAYGALTRLTDVRPGDTVFVTGAAGAVGTLAGPVARLLGARKVIGSTRSPAKAERLRSEPGYDSAVVSGGQPPSLAR